MLKAVICQSDSISIYYVLCFYFSNFYPSLGLIKFVEFDITTGLFFLESVDCRKTLVVALLVHCSLNLYLISNATSHKPIVERTHTLSQQYKNKNKKH